MGKISHNDHEKETLAMWSRQAKKEMTLIANGAIKKRFEWIANRANQIMELEKLINQLDKTDDAKEIGTIRSKILMLNYH